MWDEREKRETYGETERETVQRERERQRQYKESKERERMTEKTKQESYREMGYRKREIHAERETERENRMRTHIRRGGGGEKVIVREIKI